MWSEIVPMLYHQSARPEREEGRSRGTQDPRACAWVARQQDPQRAGHQRASELTQASSIYTQCLRSLVCVRCSGCVNFRSYPNLKGFCASGVRFCCCCSSPRFRILELSGVTVIYWLAGHAFPLAGKLSVLGSGGSP